MKAQIVNRFVCEGIMDAIHGGGTMLPYVFIPKKEIVFRIDDGALVAYRTTAEKLFEFVDFDPNIIPSVRRSAVVGEIQVPDCVVNEIEAYLEQKERAEGEASFFWKKHHKKLKK